MKIKDIVTEAAFRRGHRAAIKGMEQYPDLDNGNVPYLQYRYGLMLAGAPDIKIDDHGPTGGRLLTMAYSEADAEIIDKAARMMGVHNVPVTSNKSEEPKQVNKKSIVRDRGNIEYKKKK